MIDNNFGNVKNNEMLENSAINGPMQEPQNTEPSSFPELDSGKWIDCMPPLDDYEAKLCEEARARGYRNIAY